jgi:integrase
VTTIPVQEERVERFGESRAWTRSGVEFDFTEDQWKYQDGVCDVALDFSSLCGLSVRLRESAKASLRWYAENRSPAHLCNMFSRLLHFSRTVSNNGKCLSAIAAEDLLNYRGSLNSSREWYLGALAGLLKKWRNLGYPGIEDSAVLLLKQLKVKGNPKGVAILTMDPDNGPFTYLEVEALHAALNSAYAKAKVETSDYVLAWLYILLGQRNKQYASLKLCDVRMALDAQGNRTYEVLMPSAKRRNVDSRERLVPRPLVAPVGEVLVEYAEQVRRTYKALTPDVEQIPLFPSKVRRKGSSGFELHETAANIGVRLKETLDQLLVHSERTGEPLNINPRRFRRTLGTRAAEEGHGPLVIAGLLDHTDTQHVGVYTASSPAIIERIDRAVALEIAPLAQAFAGVIREGARGEEDSRPRILDLRIDRTGQAMGACGKHGFCRFSAPIACYTCRSFEAWLDGPHEAVLGHLIERREQLLKTSDKRIASINDRTILAVAAVVQRCSEINAQTRRGGDG